jgi:transposase InsO family protein
MSFLKRQYVHQINQIPHKAKTVTSFIHVKPIHALSIDLIDYSNRPVNNYRYVLNIIDNFSRYLWNALIKSKTPNDVIKAIEPILTKIYREHGKYPKYILSDRGGEFETEYVDYLKTLGIKTHKTIAGTPSSNGIIERSNGTIKTIMNRQKKKYQIVIGNPY